MNAHRPNSPREDYLSRLAAYAWKCYATGQHVPHGTDDERAVAAAVRTELLSLSADERERRLSTWNGRRYSRTDGILRRFVLPARFEWSGTITKDAGMPRVIRGMATTPDEDRMGDVVLPEGAQFSLPLPLLWQHNMAQPIGQVIEATPTRGGIRFAAQLPTVLQPGTLKDRVDEAWQSVQSGLVRGVSIGFRALDTEPKRGGGLTIKSWEWLELSLVTIPANANAGVQV